MKREKNEKKEKTALQTHLISYAKHKHFIVNTNPPRNKE